MLRYDDDALAAHAAAQLAPVVVRPAVAAAHGQAAVHRRRAVSGARHALRPQRRWPHHARLVELAADRLAGGAIWRESGASTMHEPSRTDVRRLYHTLSTAIS